MLDIVLIAVTIGFFAIAVSYTHTCEQLGHKEKK